jgi:hypothetical protein
LCPDLAAFGLRPAETESGSLTGEVGADHTGEVSPRDNNCAAGLRVVELVMGPASVAAPELSLQLSLR